MNMRTIKKYLAILYSVMVLLLFSQCRFFMISPLKIVSFSPSDNLVDTSGLEYIMIIFSSEVNTLITEEAFSITADGITMDGRFAWPDRRTLTFYPFDSFEPSPRYAIKITSAAEDIHGNSLEEEFFHTFRGTDDTVRPTVISTAPPDNSFLDQTKPQIEIRFSEPLDFTSLQNGFSIKPDIGGYLQETESGAVCHYVLTEDLSWQTLYTISIRDTVTDLAGNSIGRIFESRFFVGTDSDPPGILSVSEMASGIVLDADDPDDTVETVTYNIEKNSSIRIIFSEPMNKKNAKTAVGIDPGIKHYFEWNESSSELTIVPEEHYKYGIIYSLSVGSGCTDMQGNTIGTDFRYNFMADGPNSLPPSVDHVNFLNVFTVTSNDPFEYTIDDVVSLYHLDSINFSDVYNHEETLGFFDIYLNIAPDAEIDFFSFVKSFSISATNASIVPISCQINDNITFLIDEVPVEILSPGMHVIRYITAVNNSGSSDRDIPGRILLSLDSAFVDTLDNVIDEEWVATIYTTN